MVITGPTHEAPPGRPRHAPWLTLLLIVGGVLILAAGVVIAIVATNDEPGKGSAAPTVSATAPSPSPSQSGSPSASPSQSGSSATTTPFQLGYEPLYPFANRAQVLAWEESHRSGGHQPWHLDAGMTAQAFVTGYLGFDEIQLVTSSVTDSVGAHIGVGYRDPNGAAHTAAVLHLVRYGNEADAPWEVVGSDDTTFSLDTPAYGSHVTSPVTVGGRITGVDESIHVAVRQLSSEAPLGESAAVPAGGDDQPWSATVAFSGPSDTALTIVARTGGHVQQVERFVIQGVHV